jgi:hypothetical protein
MRRLVLMPILLPFLLCACYQLDTSRKPPERGTLGQEIYRILKRDMERQDPQKAAAFSGEAARFIRAFDALMPEELHDDLQAWFVDILPLYDQGILPGVVRRAACLLSEMSEDGEFLRALWYLDHPEGYGDDCVLRPLLRRILVHPDVSALLQNLGELVLLHDGLDENFQISPEDDAFRALFAELCRGLRDTEAEGPDPDSPASVGLDFLFSEDPRLLEGQGSEQYIVRTDYRGRALVAPDPGGQLPAPFCDQDQDGLADIHPQSGDFTDCAGLEVLAPPPFYPDGSRPLQDGRLVYRYSDLRQTMLAALVDQLDPLVADGMVWELPDSLPALMGPRTTLDDPDGPYPGYAPDASPAVALTHALVALLDYDRLPEFLDALLTLAELREPQLAKVLHQADLVSDIIDDWEHVSTAEDNRFLDDLVLRLQECAERGYLLPLLQAFSDPRVMSFQAGMADMIRYRDILTDTDMVFRNPTDHSLPINDYPNRSNNVKMAHLTADTNGVSHGTSVVGFEVYTIPDMLAFWLDSVAGLAHVPWYVAAAVAEFDSENPSVEEVNRFMNHDHSILGNPKGREGYELYQYNAESLLALELSGMLEGLRPLITVFVNQDRGLPRTGTQVLADLLATLHPHTSPELPYASDACADTWAVEPMLLDILDNTEIIDSAAELLSSLNGLQTASGLDVLEELDGLVYHLLKPDASIRRHDGSSSVLGNDNQTRIEPISRLYLLLDALRLVDDAVSSDPQADAALDRVAELLSDRFLEVEEQAGGWRFKNRRAWFLFLNALSFIKDRAEVHRSRGELSQKLLETEDDLRESIGGRTMPRLVDAIQILSSHPNLPGELDALLLDLVDLDDPVKVQEFRNIVGWTLQTQNSERAWIPIAHALGEYLDPDRDDWGFTPEVGCLSSAPPNTLLSRLMDMLVRMSQARGNGRDVFAEITRNLGATYPNTLEFPLDDFGDVISAIHRRDPRETGETSVDDMAECLIQTSDYLLDGERGLEKLYQQVERRKGFEY